MNQHLRGQFQKMGADETASLLATQVYLELCEVKRYWSPSYEFNPELGKIVIKAKKKPTEDVVVFVPIASFECLSFEKMQQFLSSTQTKSLFLAIVHPDSTCIYYKVTADLEEPTDATAKHLKVDKKQKLDADLRKHRELIEQAALYGIPITIPKLVSREEAEATCSSTV
ncbi:uncharacterized protein LOC109543272 [Dendroctonus ponderosae]